MIAVTGATGKLGQHVINELVKVVPAGSIIALVRNPEKAQGLKKLGVQIREANYDSPATLSTALKGVDKLLLISSSEVGKRESQHKAIIAAAVENKVRSIAYTSILKADSSKMSLAKEHLATEKAIQASGIPYTLLRNGWYLENHTENMDGALASNTVLGAAGDGKFSSASRLDYALAAVKVLTSEGHTNKTYELAGSTSFTLSQYAQALSEQTGKSITYKDLSESEFEKTLVSFGLPQAFAHLLADSDTGAKNGDLEGNSADLEKLIGRSSTPLQTEISRHLKK